MNLDGRIPPMDRACRGYLCRMWDTLDRAMELGLNTKRGNRISSPLLKHLPVKYSILSYLGI